MTADSVCCKPVETAAGTESPTPHMKAATAHMETATSRMESATPHMEAASATVWCR